jgi:hypothetical protein
MGQEIQRLSALAVTRASKPGLYADGAGFIFASVATAQRAGPFVSRCAASRAKWDWAG